MQSLLYSLNIGTLAAWLSVAGFGTVGVMVPHGQGGPDVVPIEETQWIDPDFTLVGEVAPVVDEPATAAPPAELSESVPAPPDMPAVAELNPLPEIPEVPAAPAPVASADTTPAPRPSARAVSVARPARPAPGRSANTANSANSATANPAQSNAARLAAGQMPAPDYPAEARRQGQTGTLIVEFTVDTSGRVISAVAKSPSPWPLLNEQAIRSVRRWKFPPGTIMKLQRPIIFQLR